MNMITLLTAVRDGIHDDTATSAWCVTNYSQAHNVYVGVDTRKPPDSDAYPLVHVFPISKGMGFSAEKEDHVIGMTCGIVDATTRTVSGKARVVELTGIQNIEAFRKLVETAMVAVIAAQSLTAEELLTEYDTVEFFPFFMATMTVTACADYYQGGDTWA